jgi:hypothetical protein
MSSDFLISEFYSSKLFSLQKIDFHEFIFSNENESVIII